MWHRPGDTGSAGPKKLCMLQGDAGGVRALQPPRLPPLSVDERGGEAVGVLILNSD